MLIRTINREVARSGAVLFELLRDCIIEEANKTLRSKSRITQTTLTSMDVLKIIERGCTAATNTIRACL